jgi:hypothetical protein
LFSTLTKVGSMELFENIDFNFKQYWEISYKDYPDVFFIFSQRAFQVDLVMVTVKYLGILLTKIIVFTQFFALTL